MNKLIEDVTLGNKVRVFEDRVDAGLALASLLAKNLPEDNYLVLAIPSGGVPVACEITRSLSLPLDLLIVRKIQVPWNTEVGMGAVDPEGEAIWNQGLIEQLGISKKAIKIQLEKTLAVIKERNKIFRHGRPAPDITAKSLIIVDDGLASGYTMLAALKFVKRKNPKKIIVAVPTALDSTIELVLPEVDFLVCPNIRKGLYFAVAEAYRNWYDLNDAEVISILEQN